jgi:hypothetical protein
VRSPLSAIESNLQAKRKKRATMCNKSFILLLIRLR